MIRAILMAVLTAAAAIPAHAQDMELRMLHFYESGFHPAAKAQRRYVSILPKSSTRFVYWEMTVRNKLYNVRDQSHTVVALWYRPDGTRFGRTRQTFNIRAGWASAWVSHGWGYRTPGRWKPGKYRVDIVVDGRVYVRRNFLIYDDAKIDPDAGHFAYQSVRLFESPGKAVPVSQRHYATSFNRATTRYVFAEVRGRNLLYRKRDFYPIVILRYFKDNGAYAGEMIVHRAIVRASWRDALIAGGWGWNTPGHWPAGRYRVEVWLSNDRKVGETTFTIRTGLPTTPPMTPNNDITGPEGSKPGNRPQTNNLPKRTPRNRQPGSVPRTPPPGTVTPKPPTKKSRDVQELEKL